MEQVTEKNIEKYISHLVEKEGISDSFQKQMLGTIGMYFDLCLNRKLSLKRLYPKRRQQQLPKYLSQQEVKRMLGVTDNIKHRCILKLLYGGGLRVSEVLSLTLKDVDSANMLIHINYRYPTPIVQIGIDQDIILKSFSNGIGKPDACLLRWQ